MAADVWKHALQLSHCQLFKTRPGAYSMRSGNKHNWPHLGQDGRPSNSWCSKLSRGKR